MPKRGQKKITNYELEITNKSKKEASQNQISSGLTGVRGRPAKKLRVKNLTALKAKSLEATNQLPAAMADKTEFDDEKTDRDKKLFMWVGVSCLMALFFVIWIFSLKYEFRASLKQGAGSGFNWSQAKVELDKAMSQVKQGLAEIKKIQTSVSQNASSTEPKLTPEQINLLKEKLLNEEASSTESLK